MVTCLSRSNLKIAVNFHLLNEAFDVVAHSFYGRDIHIILNIEGL